MNESLKLFFVKSSAISIVLKCVLYIVIEIYIKMKTNPNPAGQVNDLLLQHAAVAIRIRHVDNSD